MFLRTSAFSEGGEIPAKYTQEGQNISPPLEWGDVPTSAKSLALVVEDPDTPKGAWAHWLVIDLAPDSKGLTEGVTRLPKGVIGKNSWDCIGWNGPAADARRHEYVFKLYALDRELSLETPSKFDLDRLLGNAVVFAEVKIVGTYMRQQQAA